jgi:hypothetical protein
VFGPSGDGRQDVDHGLCPNGCREIAGLAVHEHVDMPAKNRTAIDQSVTQARYGPVELDQHVADSVAGDLVALFDAREQGEE